MGAFRHLALAGSVLVMATLSAPLEAKERPRELILPVTINDVDQGEHLVLLRGGDVLVKASDLTAAGVHAAEGERERYRGEEFVSLGSLAPAVRYLVDMNALTLRVTFPAASFAPKRLDLRLSRPTGIVYARDASAFLNYALTWGDAGSVNGFAEVGGSLGGKLIYSSLSRTVDGRLVRGESNLTIDDLTGLRRMVLGDSFASAGGLGGSVFLGGVSVSRVFDLDPYFVRYPTLSLAGAVTTPSTAEIYVNGALVGRESLPPGQFDLTDLQVPAGSGTATVVIRDSFGQERVLTNPFYASSAVLAPGLQEYSYNLGFRRGNLATASGDYGRLSFLAYHRFGLTDRLTPGFRLEGDRHLVSGGPFVALRLGLGEVEAGVSSSSAAGGSGSAWSLAYRYIGKPVNFGLFARGATTHYATLSLTPAQDRARVETQGFAGLQFGGRLGVTAQLTRTEMRDTSTMTRAALTANFTTMRYGTLFLSGGRTRQGGRGSNEVLVGFSYSYGPASMATVSGGRQDGASSASLDVLKSLPVGPGFGYRADLRQSEGATDGYAVAQFQGTCGRVEVSADRSADRTSASVSLSGGIIAIGDRVLVSRNVGQSFALIQVPGIEGVTGYVNNQAAGTTDRHGDLLVPDLLPYYGNRLAIADADIPIDYQIDATELVVAPPYRGGALATFPVHRARMVRGTLVIEWEGAELVPALGSLSVGTGGETVESPLGSRGEFYFDDLAPGAHRARADFRRGTCTFVLHVPAGERPFLDVGRVVCVAHALQQEAP